jgi:hypothetical protein
MDYETIPLSQLETHPRTTPEDCVNTGRTVVVELPDHRRVILQPLDGADDGDDLIDRLIERNAGFRRLLTESDASGRKPFDFTPEPE